MLSLRIVEQHNRGGDVIVAPVMAGPRHRHDRLAAHVAIEQFGDIADAETVGIVTTALPSNFIMLGGRNAAA
jgi:hypothetical protein